MGTKIFDLVTLKFDLGFWPQVLLCLFPGVLWLWHFLYSVGPHQVPSLHIYTFVVSRAFMAGAASQAGDTDSSRAPGLTSGLQGSVNIHRGDLLLVPQWQCISSFVFYYLKKNFDHGHYFITRRGRAFIHHMYISCDNTFPWVPKVLTQRPWPWSLTYFWKTLT